MRVIGKPTTTPTSSDHDAVTVVLEVGGEEVGVTTWNVGDGPMARKKANAARLAEGCKVMLLQEVGDRDVADLLGRGWSHWKKSRVAVAWRSDFPATERLDHLLSSAAEGRNMDKGAGPEDVGVKHLVGILAEVGGEPVSFGVVHLVASSYKPKRGKLARLQTSRIAGWVQQQPGHVVVGGDWNTLPGNAITWPLRNLGMDYTRTGPTHKSKRQIDYIFTLDKATLPPPEEPDMPKIEAPSPPYVGPPKWHGGGGNKPIKRIVIHCTAGSEPGVKDSARSTARYSKNTDRPSSWHYAADSLESVQLTYDSIVAYHCGYNSNSIGYELCCSLSNEGGVLIKAKTGAKAVMHWTSPSHRLMLRIAAKDVAQLCLAYDVPIRKLSIAQLRAQEEGLCGHVDIRDAFPGSTTHWDPGPFFPWKRFIRMVRNEARKMTEPTEPKPPAKPSRGFRVLAAERLLKLAHKRSTRVGHEGNKAALAEALAALGRVEPE